MQDLDQTVSEAQNQTPETAGAEGMVMPGLNKSDPVPALGGATRDAAELRDAGRISIEKLDDGLFAAVLAGDENYVRARLGGADKPLTEAEELLLIRTRRHEDEIAYAHVLEQEKAQKAEEKEERHELMLAELEAGVALAALEEGTDVYGGWLDRKQAVYRDRFGGEYDAKGYLFANGSYKTAGGDIYDAAAHTVRFAVGGPDIALSGDLLGMGADVLRLAIRISEIREQARMEALETAGIAPAEAAQAAQTAAGTVHAIVSAAPKALAASLPSLRSAVDSDAAYADFCAAQEKAEKAKFLKLAEGGDFKAAAYAAPGGALDAMDCNCLTHKDVRKAADIMSENLAKGLAPHMMTRYQFKDILCMADDAEDKLACALRAHPVDLDMGPPSPLTQAANNAFSRMPPVANDIGYNLRDKAAAVFGKPANDPLANILKKSLRRTGMAMA